RSRGRLPDPERPRGRGDTMNDPTLHAAHDGDTPPLRDPVCGMTVKPDSPHRFEHGGRSWHFCSAHCVQKFAADPARYDGSAAPAPPEDRDPVCGMTVKPDTPHHLEHAGHTWRFCSARCVEKFSADPARY